MKANYGSVQVGKDYAILCSDKHASFLRKHKKDPANYRPDILHQVGLWSILRMSKNPERLVTFVVSVSAESPGLSVESCWSPPSLRAHYAECAHRGEIFMMIFDLKR